MTLLAPDSLEFARNHIERFYDSDFFPKPAEYIAILASWQEVKKHLTSRNIDKLPVSPPRTMPAPKANGGFRVVHQLDPLNALTYTALAHQVASHVETARFPADVACAYRIALDGGSFFSAGTGHDVFAARCEELSLQFRHVLVADLADFYNRVYLHRLNNALVHANGGLTAIAADIESFLLRINSKASQGIPVGPAASIIMAEAICSDIDQFAHNAGIVHVRYVDDFRFFSQTEVGLQAFLERLVAYLFDAHRLQIAWEKTGIISSEAFRERFLQTPERLEKLELLEVVRELSEYPDRYVDDDAQTLTAKYLAADPPPPPTPRRGDLFGRLRVRFAQIEAEHRHQVRREAFMRLLERAAAATPVDIGLARRVLRTCRTLQVADVVETILGNFHRLQSIVPDVCLYLDAITTPQLAGEILGAVRTLVVDRNRYMPDFVRYWLYWYVSGHFAFMSDHRIARDVLLNAPIEWQARAATTTRNLAWVRSQKATFGQRGPWERRAIMLASQVMPKDERQPWLSSLKGSAEDVLEAVVAQWVLGLA